MLLLYLYMQITKFNNYTIYSSITVLFVGADDTIILMEYSEEPT
jgi:hypothetical protein